LNTAKGKIREKLKSEELSIFNNLVRVTEEAVHWRNCLCGSN
jgi:hypothetical protein